MHIRPYTPGKQTAGRYQARDHHAVDGVRTSQRSSIPKFILRFGQSETRIGKETIPNPAANRISSAGDHSIGGNARATPRNTNVENGTLSCMMASNVTGYSGLLQKTLGPNVKTGSRRGA